MHKSITLPDYELEKETDALIEFFRMIVGNGFAEFSTKNRRYISVSLLHSKTRIMNEMLKAFHSE